jgi:hypothetical protein
MVERDTMSANSRTASSRQRKLARADLQFVDLRQCGVSGVAAAGGGVVRSYKNNPINANAVDGTPITREILN